NPLRSTRRLLAHVFGADRVPLRRDVAVVPRWICSEWRYPRLSREGLVVIRSIDHVGFTVPDLDEAVEFFCDVLGCELVLREGTYDNCGYVWPGESEPERATVRLAILRHGDSHNVELLEYREPESGVRP